MGSLATLPPFVPATPKRLEPAEGKMILADICNRLIVTSTRRIHQFSIAGLAPFRRLLLPPSLHQHACADVRMKASTTAPSSRRTASSTSSDAAVGAAYASCDQLPPDRPRVTPDTAPYTLRFSPAHRLGGVVTDAPCHPSRSAPALTGLCRERPRALPMATHQRNHLSDPKRLPPMGPRRRTPCWRLGHDFGTATDALA